MSLLRTLSMSKCDYTDNWASECQEEVAFWSFQQWEQEMEAAGWHASLRED